MSLSNRNVRVMAVALLASVLPLAAFAQARPPLSAADVADIVTLEKIEDRRNYDTAALQRIATAPHPELRRRAVLAIARLYDWRGRDLLKSMRAETDTAVLATVVWATGQLVDTSAVEWIDSLLRDENTPTGVATEAAGAFGKIRTSDTRLRLALYLNDAVPGPKSAAAVAEALLSIGRHRDRGDITSIARWAASPDDELRWRAAWALFRPRDPIAIPELLQLSKDPSPEVRFWAVRGLTGPRADSSGVGAAVAQQAIMEALGSDDRRVQVEAVRALGSHADGVSLVQLILLLEAEDPWIATMAAEAIGSRGDNARAAIAQLGQATGADHPAWVRAAALTALADVWLSAAQQPAIAMAKDTSLTVRTAAVGVLARLKVGGRVGLAALRNDAARAVRTAAHAMWLFARARPVRWPSGRSHPTFRCFLVPSRSPSRTAL